MAQHRAVCGARKHSEVQRTSSSQPVQSNNTKQRLPAAHRHLTTLLQAAVEGIVRHLVCQTRRRILSPRSNPKNRGPNFFHLHRLMMDSEKTLKNHLRDSPGEKVDGDILKSAEGLVMGMDATVRGEVRRGDSDGVEKLFLLKEGRTGSRVTIQKKVRRIFTTEFSHRYLSVRSFGLFRKECRFSPKFFTNNKSKWGYTETIFRHFQPIMQKKFSFRTLQMPKISPVGRLPPTIAKYSNAAILSTHGGKNCFTQSRSRRGGTSRCRRARHEQEPPQQKPSKAKSWFLR